MNYLREFLAQDVPKSGREMPAYYRMSLRVCEAILAACFLAGIVLIAVTTNKLEWVPVAVLAGVVLCFFATDKLSANIDLICITAIIVTWLTWFVYTFGWSAGSPNILIPLLSLVFFNIFISPRAKVLYCLGFMVFRIVLYAFSLRHTASGALSASANLSFQILNSVIPLIILANNYILFSSSIQASERQLTIYNQELHIEAGTDPLTGLPNRRALLDVVDQYLKNDPDSQFCVAIADIDFFKRVNDTYGHNCGDYTLKELAKLFLARSESKYTVCRWGGEEFCFFLPEMNLDEAGIIMHDLHAAVKRMPLHDGDIDFNITITIGVEENDFMSSMDELFNHADRKLYMGKANGRNQIVL